jgi:hypothetical protein
MAERDGWIYEPAPGGGFIGYSADARPSIQANHIDGPLLSARNGQLHWLTLWERFLFALGLTDAERLERKRFPHIGGDND